MRNGEVVIIDEFTGRMMPGRRYSEGLHQALEAKEHQPIQPENQTLASITFQNYFRMYEKLAGMTGTALDRSGRVPRHLQARSAGNPDQHAAASASTTTTRSIARRARNTAPIIALIEDCKQRGQPVLVGTTSIEKSEQLAEHVAQGGLGAARLHRSQRVRGALFRRRRRRQDQGVRHPQRPLSRAGSLHRRRRPACRAR